MQPSSNNCYDTGLREECGVFGIYDLDGADVSPSIYYGLSALQHRGQESCGIAVSDTSGPKGHVKSYKGLGLVNEVFKESKLEELSGNIDPELSLEMMELLERVSQTGITVLVVTHEHELVHRFHQRVVTLKNGRIISDIPADPEAIAARSAELNAWKELTEPVDDEPDEQNDETKEKEAATV